MGYASLNCPAGSWHRAQTMSGGLLNWALGEIEPVLHSRHSAASSSATTSDGRHSDESGRSNGGSSDSGSGSSAGRRAQQASGQKDETRAARMSAAAATRPARASSLACNGDSMDADEDSDGGHSGSEGGSDAPSNGSGSSSSSATGLLGVASFGATSSSLSGTPAPGEPRHPPMRRRLRLLTNDEAVAIYLAKLGPKSMKAAARLAHEFGVSAKAIRDVWTRKTWVVETMHVWSMTTSNNFVPLGVSSSSGSAAVAAMRVRRALRAAEAP
jgi:hypothetical protein